MSRKELNVVDLFSGAGGMSYGFSEHPLFRLVAAADAEIGKPSSGRGKLQCNNTYERNVGIRPTLADLSRVAPDQLRDVLRLPTGTPTHVLAVCPPCTGFSRANPQNHLRDDKRNSLVRKSAEFAVSLDADIVVMENARELVRGNFRNHYIWFREHLENSGYRVSGKTYFLSRFGLPQIRERAIVVAVKRHLDLQTLDTLWSEWKVHESCLTVRRAFAEVDKSASGADLHPGFSTGAVRTRIAAIPKDGGSWADLLGRPDESVLLTGSMKRIVAAGKMGSYPDVYGRMAWDKPAPTIKRECSHVGNGRYAHPEEDRLCSVREMAMLQGFPNSFVFDSAAVSNMYRHIGDAVPPMISHQLAHVCSWILTGIRPAMSEVILRGTSLRSGDLSQDRQEELFCA